ncbi:MAG: hypothetical protein JWO77_252 [Ilumatobacteraceae bacterium]|nr:hypothetical protein [Ilumatobacteraceae bacterium]
MLDATPAVPPSPEVEAAGASDPARAPQEGQPTSLRKRLRWPFLTAFLVELMLVVGDRIPSVDSMSYFETGRNFVNGDGYTRAGAPEMHFPPVAPVSFGLLEKLTGNEMFALRTWELFWALAAVLILTAVAWFISRKDDVVVATAWIAVAVPGVVTLSIRAGSGSELPVVVMLIASALLTLLAVDRTAERSTARRVGLLVGAGALVGLAYLTRPEALMPGAVIGLAVFLFALRQPDVSWAGRAKLVLRNCAAFGFAALLFVAPYVNYTHSNSGSWSLTSKTKDASIDAWRAVAQDDRLERDQILYSIQPDGVSLGPETVSLTKIAREHPRNWLTIAWINSTTIVGDYVGRPWETGPTWELIPLFLLVPAVWQMWRTRHKGSTLLFVGLGAAPLATCFLFFALPRYLMMTTAVLIPFGAWGLVEWTNRLALGKRRLAWWVMGGLMVLSLVVAAWNLLPLSSTPERTEQRTAGEWIAANTPEDARVMTRSFHVQGYSHRDVVAMPSAEYRAMLEFARRMGVKYLVADENTIKRRRPEVYDILMRETGSPAGLKLVHQFTERGTRVKIYELDPPAPPTLQPPLPLGYVAD